MAVAAQKSIASLMRKTLDRQEATARINFRFKERQVEKIILRVVKDRNSVPYNELIKVLREYPLNDDNYKILIEDCLTCVMLLGREFKQFLALVCKVDWSGRSEECVELFGRFILNLVTAHTYHCPMVLANLITQFKANGDNWDEHPPAETVKLWSNIHSLIAQIVATMPMTSDLLMQIVIEQFPYYKAGCFPNRAYIHNLIWMTKYLPSLREHIMTAIVIRMVEMDSNIVDRAKNKQPELMFEMETDEKDELAPTLDYCMLEMLRWLEDERDPVLFTICNVFERIVLPTHGIKHVQFLLLYATSISQACADRVLERLWAAAAGAGAGLQGGAPATRRTAAAHLAGLLARAVRVPNTRLIHYLRNMSEWCHSYITATQETTSNDNTKVHGAFHAICHSIFYLVAFKHHHLFASKENVNFVESLNLPRLVTCNLNPLRTCPPQVTRGFASVTRSHQVVYCQAIIEKNSRVTLQASNVQEYDDWFPYDPYMLPVSGKMIWPLCVEYKDWGRDNEDETQYSGMKRKLEEDDDFLMTASPSQKLASSLSNCVSPGFRTSESVM
ncbi:RNA polymerase I-specific transcription initiation factor RRN3 [Cydia fagiglandana]|uniref:RNA polymerase I-specific transcription initiation factor RRN3 n=1 Tax=Cydia fagiglandana TaxID=1458189 RepID=UPI002FEDEE18